MLRGMKAVLFLPVAYVLDIEGFLLVGPYLVLFLIAAGLLAYRTRRPAARRAAAAPTLSDTFNRRVNLVAAA